MMPVRNRKIAKKLGKENPENFIEKDEIIESESERNLEVHKITDVLGNTYKIGIDDFMISDKQKKKFLKDTYEEIFHKEFPEAMYEEDAENIDTDFRCPKCRTHKKPNSKYKYSSDLFGYTEHKLNVCVECGHEFKNRELNRKLRSAEDRKMRKLKRAKEIKQR